MKKINLLAAALTLLISQTGCVGPKQEDATAFPYATAEIQGKLAKRISPNLHTIPKNYFETLDYSPFYGQLDEILEVLNTPEEKQFWQTLICLRLQMLALTSMAEDVELLDEQLQNADASPEVLASVLAYEKAHPYTPDLTETDKIRTYMIGMALGMMPIPPSDEEAEKYIEQWGGRDTAKFFQMVREELLKHFETSIQQRQNGQTPKSYEEAKRGEHGIAEYAVHFFGPALYPAEMMFAELVLSPTNDDARYAYPALFFKNETPSESHSIRLENEKPLPYKLDLMWYSVTENKVYALETDLPRETLKEKILGEGETWDALLFTLEPYGKVTLYAYNQISNKKEKLASFDAKEKDVPFDLFKENFAQYDSRENPSKNWKEYRQTALGKFPKAAENLNLHGRPVMPGPEVNYWEENPENIFEGVPEPEALNTPDKNGQTPLMNAVRHNKENTVSTLIALGADVNYQAPSGETALSLAVNMNYAPFAQQLIAAKADVNKRDTSSGRTPLIDAAMNGNEEIIKALLAAGANINDRVVLYGQTLEENALTAALNNGHDKTADLLRSAGTEEIAPSQPTAAAQQAADEMYKAMGITPLHYALLTGDTSKVKELLASGEKVNQQAPNMGTPLYYACTVGNVEAARLLAEAGADVNIPGDTGYTPLMMACQLGNAELVQILLERGADVNAKHVLDGQESGLTPLKLAQDYGHNEIAAILVAAGAH